MTTEVAVANKLGVALAADSAATISVGTSQEKVYESADKLFELSCVCPIGVMINGNLNFLEIPYQVLIKEFRNKNKKYKCVKDALSDFLIFLAAQTFTSSEEVIRRTIRHELKPLIDDIVRDLTGAFERVVFQDGNIKPEVFDDPDKLATLIYDERSLSIKHFETVVQRLPDPGLTPETGSNSLLDEDAFVHDLAYQRIRQIDPRLVDRVADILKTVRKRASFSPTGIVAAGFGTDELFPTILSVSIHGIYNGRLKFSIRDEVDIDRDGKRAAVMSFAQKDMIERFLYGLDDDVRDQVAEFCRLGLVEIEKAVTSAMTISDEDRPVVSERFAASREAFMDGLRKTAFSGIVDVAVSEIDSLVEHMPKAELARMAEALVSLASMRGKVSRGMETVGGPVDCAVISRAEGFVWIRRKHYFPAELNARYFVRSRAMANGSAGDEDGTS